MMTKGEGGQKFQKFDDVFYERPHIVIQCFSTQNRTPIDFDAGACQYIP